MPGLNDVLEVARRALTSQRLGINVTSNNVANASTPGYSRQRVDFTQSPSVKTQFGMLGSGVTASHIGRIRERFIDQQIRHNNDALGFSTMQRNVLAQIEAAVNEPSETGINTALNNFFNTFQELAVRPAESSARNNVVQKGTLLTQSIHRLYSNINSLRENLTQDVENKVKEINQISKDLAQLNERIIAARAGGAVASDLEDLRDLKIDRLSALAKVQVSDSGNGAKLVSMNGVSIVNDVDFNAIKIQADGGKLQIVSEANGRVLSADTGELGGTLTSYNSTIPNYVERLNTFAKRLMDRINEVHSSGYTITNPTQTGIMFFTGTSAADIEVNSQIANNVNLIAVSADGRAGDNTNALALADLLSEKMLSDNSQTLSQFYAGFASDVGTGVNNAKNTVTMQELILAQLDQQKSSVSGVSVDEEMTNLIKYQRAYDAAAKVITTVNEMFESLIRMV